MVTIGPLNKSSPTVQFWMDAEVVAQSISGNYSTIRITLRAYNTGDSSSRFLNVGTHYGAIDGIGQIVNHTVNPFLPNTAPGALRWALSGDYNYGHDANGFAGALIVRMGVSYGSINESHTATLTIPRIPKPPSSPGMPVASSITAQGMTLSWAPPVDNRGAALTGYALQRASNAAFTAGVVQYDLPLTTSHTRLDLTPGSQYFWRVAAKNIAGTGAMSGVLESRTLSGARVGRGGAFSAAEVRIGRGGAFVPVPAVRVGKGGLFIPAG